MKFCTRQRWEPEAVAWLHEHAPQMRFKLLVERYREAAQQNGWSPRTITAFRVKLSELGLGSSRQVINLDTGEIYPAPKNAARAVGRKAESLRSSIRAGGTCAGYRWAYVGELKEQRHA
jgi:hypothetical protein